MGNKSMIKVLKWRNGSSKWLIAVTALPFVLEAGCPIRYLSQTVINSVITLPIAALVMWTVQVGVKWCWCRTHYIKYAAELPDLSPQLWIFTGNVQPKAMLDLEALLPYSTVITALQYLEQNSVLWCTSLQVNRLLGTLLSHALQQQNKTRHHIQLNQLRRVE